jgi:hypothetical protein
MTEKEEIDKLKKKLKRAKKVTEKLLSAIYSMPCSAEEFLGEDLYNEAHFCRLRLLS